MKTVYVDMDGVVADYESAKKRTTEEQRKEPGFFLRLEPILEGIAAVTVLANFYEVYFLSTAPWSNTHALSEKRRWIDIYFGEVSFKKLILSHNKGLMKGEYLIDDRIANGVENFEGKHIHFGTDFLTWRSVLSYMQERDSLGTALTERFDAIINMRREKLESLREEMKGQQGKLVLDDLRVVRLLDVIDNSEDFYWVYFDGSKVYHSSCVGGWRALDSIPDYDKMEKHFRDRFEKSDVS
jgi:protein-tyrosine-phosphatase